MCQDRAPLELVATAKRNADPRAGGRIAYFFARVRRDRDPFTGECSFLSRGFFTLEHPRRRRTPRLLYDPALELLGPGLEVARHGDEPDVS